MSTPDYPAAVAVAVSEFGAAVAPRLQGPGEPEDQLRGPLEGFFGASAAALRLNAVFHGESSLADLRVRPDYAVQVDGAICGYVEVKAPGKGVDPAAWRERSHDRVQFDKLSALPNVLYTDGQEWALYRGGERVGEVERLDGNVRTAGARLAPRGSGLAGLLESFLRWAPTPPRTLDGLVRDVAGLCHLLRDEVVDAMGRERASGDGGPFTSLAADWRHLLFPDADDETFADGYAQTVTFGLLLARVDGIDFAGRDLLQVSRLLGKRHGLMGAALEVLSDDRLGDLGVTLGTLFRVVGAVDWEALAGGEVAAADDDPGADPTAVGSGADDDPYLHLYERFLGVYDPDLRKRTGSYYTPAELVAGMTGFVEDLLVGRLGKHLGYAADEVVTVDPATGTGTYLLSVLDRAAVRVAAEEGPGAVPARLRSMASRVVGMERQTGPFAVAELRVHEALRRHGAEPPKDGIPLYLADTLSDPQEETAHLFSSTEPIARSRRDAARVRREVPVTVVIGNPPYRHGASGQGGWVERGAPERGEKAPLDGFRTEGAIGGHEKALSNLLVFFWRWATWKVFDAHPQDAAGVVAFVTTGAFATSPGFAGMREYLRRTCDEGWVVDLTPEGHQPDTGTRVFPGVQQPLGVAFFVRYGSPDPNTPATVHHLALEGDRRDKLKSLAKLSPSPAGWTDCPSDWRAQFVIARDASWEVMPLVADLMPLRSPGVQPNRTWVYAPEPATLRARWDRLVAAPAEEKPALFKEARDANLVKVKPPLHGFPRRPSFRDTHGPFPDPVPVGYRSFDQQWAIPDARLLSNPRPPLWEWRGPAQVYTTEQHDQPGTQGPALTFTAHPPDLHHHAGRSGRALPLWRDAAATEPNAAAGVLNRLSETHGEVTAPDLLAYAAAVAAHPGYTDRFQDGLAVNGAVRLPLTEDTDMWDEAVELGRRVIWLHTHGERYTDEDAARPAGRPRLPAGRRPLVVEAIPHTEDGMPRGIAFDPAEGGSLMLSPGGRVGPVSEAVWDYRVNRMQVVKKWFGYRRHEPAGKRTSPLDDIHATTWTPDTTVGLLNLLNVLGLVVDLEPAQADLLGRIMRAPLLTLGSGG